MNLYLINIYQKLNDIVLEIIYDDVILTLNSTNSREQMEIGLYITTRLELTGFYKALRP